MFVECESERAEQSCEHCSTYFVASTLWGKKLHRFISAITLSKRFTVKWVIGTYVPQ